MSPPRDIGPNLITSLPFLPDSVWIFLIAFVVQEPLCQSHKFSVRIALNVDVLLMCFLGGGEFCVLLLCHLALFHLFFFKFYLFIYLFMAVLGLRFCARAFSSYGKRGPLFIAVREPLTVAASPVVEHRLQTRRLSNCGSRA